jgi:cAMP-dependent protein kinase regulator
VASLQSIDVGAGETIVRRGGPADRFFILVEGEAVVTTDEAGEGEPIHSLGPGQVFGEVAILRDQPRSATVRAKTDTKLLALERDTFRDLIAQSMEITPDFDQIIRSRLEATGR